MSSIKVNAVQIGQSGTSNNNFTLNVPATPDGTIKLSRGIPGSLGADVLSIDSSGNIAAVVNEVAPVTLASAATTNIGSATSNTVNISGTATITSLGTAAIGITRRLVFSGALVLTHNSISLILPGGSSITTAAGDVAEFLSLGSGNWRCTFYQKYSGVSIATGIPDGVYLQKLVTQSSTTFTVPAGKTKIRAYAGGAGGNGAIANPAGGGGGGGFAFGDITVQSGDTITISISNGVAKVSKTGIDLLTANPGSNASGGTGGAGGTASIHASVLNGAAYSGGSGGSASLNGSGNAAAAGGGSAGSPLGNGFSGGSALNVPSSTFIYSGGGGIGGTGSNGGGGGGAGGTASSLKGACSGTALLPRVVPYTDPLLKDLNGSGGDVGNPGGSGAGGGGGDFIANTITRAGNGGFGGGGGGGGGAGGELGGGGGINSSAGAFPNPNSAACGGAGGSTGGGTTPTGGPATVWLFY